jgi:hypothetical protein
MDAFKGGTKTPTGPPEGAILAMNELELPGWLPDVKGKELPEV